MEEAAAFRLEEAIAEWRERLRASPGVGGADADELEGHLRDVITECIGHGMCEAEAFAQAAERIGPIGQVGAEFAKLNRRGVWLDRIQWMTVGVLGWCVLWEATTLAAIACITAIIWGLGQPLIAASTALVDSRGTTYLNAFSLTRYVEMIAVAGTLRLVVQGAMIVGVLLMVRRWAPAISASRTLASPLRRLAVAGLACALVYVLYIGPFIVAIRVFSVADANHAYRPGSRLAQLADFWYHGGYPLARLTDGMPATLLQAVLIAVGTRWIARVSTQPDEARLLAPSDRRAVWMAIAVVGINLLGRVASLLAVPAVVGGLLALHYGFTPFPWALLGGLLVLGAEYGLVVLIAMRVWHTSNQPDGMIRRLGRRPLLLGVGSAVLWLVATLGAAAQQIYLQRRLPTAEFGGVIQAVNSGPGLQRLLLPLVCGSLLAWLARREKDVREIGGRR